MDYNTALSRMQCPGHIRNPCPPLHAKTHRSHRLQAWDLIIVGAGVAGAALAYKQAKVGCDVHCVAASPRAHCTGMGAQPLHGHGTPQPPGPLPRPQMYLVADGN